MQVFFKPQMLSLQQIKTQNNLNEELPYFFVKNNIIVIINKKIQRVHFISKLRINFFKNLIFLMIQFDSDGLNKHKVPKTNISRNASYFVDGVFLNLKVQ